MKPVFKRILLKLSGEALMGAQNYGIDTKVAEASREEIKTVHDLGVEIAIVVGGGNIFRGVSNPRAIWTARRPIISACSRRL